jgi:hypothetical protein
MAMRLSALRAGSPLSHEDFLYSFMLTSEIDPRAMVRLEKLGQLKYPATWEMIPTPSGL